MRTEGEPADALATRPEAQGDDLDGIVRTLGDHARTVNLARATGLAGALDQLAGAGLSGPERDTAAELAHQLIGSAGTFGFAEASRLAAHLEQFFLDGDFSPARLSAARVHTASLLARLALDPDLD